LLKTLSEPQFCRKIGLLRDKMLRAYAKHKDTVCRNPCPQFPHTLPNVPCLVRLTCQLIKKGALNQTPSCRLVETQARHLPFHAVGDPLLVLQCLSNLLTFA
jgi:hypothetical protein